VVQVASGLEHPWALAWLPDGRMLVTERPGKLLLLHEGRVTNVEGLPRIHSQGQGGLLDLALHPDHARNGLDLLHLLQPRATTTPRPRRIVEPAPALARAGSARTARGSSTCRRSTRRPRGTSPGRHYGSRIVFPGDGTVIFSIGDRGCAGRRRT
jgi:aldose sugar dehydrogenase